MAANSAARTEAGGDGLRGTRIAILLAALEPAGAERVAVNLANEFLANGLDVDLVVVRAHGPLQDHVSQSVRLVDLAANRAATAIYPFRRYLRRERPDVVLSIGFEVNLTASFALVGLTHKPRLVLSVHCAIEPYFQTASFPWGAGAFLASKIMYPRADRIVAVSHGIATELCSLKWASREQILVVHNPVIGYDFNDLLKQKTDHPWVLDRTVPLVVTAGRLTAQKDHALLIEAFGQVAERRPVRLLIMGEGDLRAELEQQIARSGLVGQVALLGQVPNPFPIIRAADLFVLSSAYEGFGNVLVEAMAAGTRVISTDCPHGPSEILEGGKWGRLVAVGDVAALATAIDEALDTPGPSAVTRGGEFTVEAAGAKYLELMKAL